MDATDMIFIFLGGMALTLAIIFAIGKTLDVPRQVECHELEKIATLYGNLTDKQKEIVFDKCDHEILKIKPYS